MHEDRTARMGARASLCGRLGDLAARADTLAPTLLAERIEAIRREAAGCGMVAADRVGRAFARAVAASRCRNGYPHWFAALSDAIGCEAADAEATADACLAAVMVRMG